MNIVANDEKCPPTGARPIPTERARMRTWPPTVTALRAPLTRHRGRSGHVQCSATRPWSRRVLTWHCCERDVWRCLARCVAFRIRLNEHTANVAESLFARQSGFQMFLSFVSTLGLFVFANAQVVFRTITPVGIAYKIQREWRWPVLSHFEIVVSLVRW